jgi:hypothetical protein
MAVFKIIGRYSGREPFWMHSRKAGIQARKTIYTSLADFQKHGTRTAERWMKYNKWDVEAYKLLDSGEWIKCGLPSGIEIKGDE